MQNREIKFRAWDSEKKCFVPQGEIVFRDYGDTSIEVYPNDLSYVGDKCHNGEPQRGRFITNQYTGLKDKNGKEIYEGDIQDYGSGRVVIVEFQNGCFGLVMPGGQFEKTWIRPNQFEVIGNIYENPELLKP